MKSTHMHNNGRSGLIVRTAKKSWQLIYSLLSWILKDGGSGNIYL